MKPVEPTPRSIRIYHVCFVIVLTLLFLFVMYMSLQAQGFGQLEEGFFQRSFLIENFNHLRIKLGDRVFNSVLRGKDGWFEYTGNKNLDVYQNAIKLSPGRLANLAATIQSCHEFAAEHDMTFLIVVAPNKATIYPDKLPEQIQPLSDQSLLDQLNGYLRAHDVPEVLDLRPALLDARREHQIYYKLGTHWNRYGAYVAYETIINTLSPSHPELAPYSAKFFRFKKTTKMVDNEVARMIHAHYLPSEPNLLPTRDLDGILYELKFPIPRTMYGYHKLSWVSDSDLPALLMYHDSFGDAGLNQFLGLNFSKGHFIHRNASPLFLNRKTMEQFAPDVIIFEIVERNLDGMEGQLRGCVED